MFFITLLTFIIILMKTSYYTTQIEIQFILIKSLYSVTILILFCMLKLLAIAVVCFYGILEILVIGFDN